MSTRRHFNRQIAAAVAASIAYPFARAQAWPAKPITMIAPYPPGGGVDVVARLIAEKLAARLGQAVNVDNKPGAGATLGGTALARSAPDGYTLMLGSIVDYAIAPHVHKALDELMYVHKGTVSVLVGNEVTEVKAGGWHFRPRGIVHTFWNSGDQPVLATDMYFNQNFEDFLEELFFKIIPDMNKRNLTPMDTEIARRMEDLDKRFGVTTFGNQRQAIVDKYGLK